MATGYHFGARRDGDGGERYGTADATERGQVKALSVRSPWRWFILHAGKDIENRDWPTKFRGIIDLNASKWWNEMEIANDEASAIRCADWMSDSVRWPDTETVNL
jgi:hypothetical protein